MWTLSTDGDGRLFPPAPGRDLRRRRPVASGVGVQRSFRDMSQIIEGILQEADSPPEMCVSLARPSDHRRHEFRTVVVRHKSTGVMERRPDRQDEEVVKEQPVTVEPGPENDPSLPRG